MPEPESLAELVEASAVSEPIRVGSCVPHYWRCTVSRFEVVYPTQTLVRYLVTRCQRGDRRLEFRVALERELSPEIQAMIMRDVPLRYVELRNDGLAFAGARSEFSGVDNFIDLRDILRWNAAGF